MMKKPSLLTLYDSVVVPIYSEWISVEDLFFLDTAVCSQEHRNKFLDALKLCYIKSEVLEQNRLIAWAFLRGTRVHYMEISSWSPVVQALIQSNRLSYLSITLNLLVLHLGLIQNNVRNIEIRVSDSLDTSQLKTAGPAITALFLYSVSSESVKIITSYCPNVKKVFSPIGSFILPLIDAYQLDEIYNCHLGSLVKRKQCDCTYSCNLRRTSEVNDETAVCLGEGKYYHMTQLFCWQKMTQQEAQLLIPLLPNVTDCITSWMNYPLVNSAVLEKCFKLIHLSFVYPANLLELSLLLKQSPLLRDLEICGHKLDRLIFDEFIVVMFTCCPLLEVCKLSDCVVESESIMSEFFNKCLYLTEFQATQWPYEAVLHSARNLKKLAVGQCGRVHKSGRGLCELRIPQQVNRDLLCAVLLQNPNIHFLDLINWKGDSLFVIVALIQSWSLMTSHNMTIISCSVVKLSGEDHLTSLSVCRCQSFTVKSLAEILSEAPLLLSLTLADCNVTSGMVSVIARLCPSLTSLNLSNNKDIQDADIVRLLFSCTKLEVLTLQGCRSVTSAILASVRSPPMKALHALRSGIDITETTDIEYVQWDKS